MKRFAQTLALVSLLGLLAGCASVKDQTQSKLNFVSGGKTISIVSPKDVSFDSVTVNPETGAVEVRGYKSVANASAVAAAASQAQAQAQMGADMLATVKTLAEGYAKAQGVPVPASTSAKKNYD